MRQLLFLAILVHVIAAWFSIGYHNFDEHFQTLEFAGYKAGLTTAKDLPWEFHEQMRPALQPFIAFAVLKSAYFLGSQDPFLIAFLLRLFSAVFSICALLALLKAYQDEFGIEKKKLLYELGLLAWFMVYLHVRFSSESWAGSAFFAGIAFWKLAETVPKRKLLYALFAGFLFGLSFEFRYQAGFMLAGLFLWLLIIGKPGFPKFALLIAGALIAVSAGTLTDHWLYGRWVLAPWHYLDQNILQDKVSQFGTDPWWYYFKEVFNQFPPFSLLIIGGVVAMWIYYPKHILSWVSLPFILIHILIGHKELRFLFPLVNMLPVAVLLVLEKFKNKFPVKAGNRMLGSYRVVNAVLLLIICFKPADNYTQLYKFVYKHYHDKTTALLYNGKNPYERVTLPLRFYRSANLEVEDLKEIQDTRTYPHQKILIADNHLEPDTTIRKVPGRLALRYRTIPDFLLKFNFNNWLSRTEIWSIYELERP